MPKVTLPATGAVQRNQTEAPPSSACQCQGSPGSRVAPTVVCFSDPESPETARAEAKASFAGGGPEFQRNTKPPWYQRKSASASRPFSPSTAIQYVVPATAVKAILLWRSSRQSSFLATGESPETRLPV